MSRGTQSFQLENDYNPIINLQFADLATNQKLEVKPSKIVAGLEADKTNEIFQLLAHLIDNNVDTKDAIKSLKRGPIQNGNAKAASKTSPKVEEKKEEPKSENKPLKEKTSTTKVDTKKKLTSQNSIEKKVSAAKVEKVKEKDRNGKDSRSTSKTRTSTDAKEAPKKIKRISSKDNKESTTSSSKRNSLLTNGSVDSQNSLTNQQSQQPQSLTIEETAEIVHSKVDDTKLQETSANNVENQEHENVEINGVHSEKENEEPESLPAQQQQMKPQDELVAIIDEEAEYRRREKATKKSSSRGRQKSIEDQQPQQIENSHEVPPVAPPKLEVNQTFKREERQERPKTSLRPPSARPASSRPAAPRRREKNVIEIILQPDETVKLGEITVKMENFTKELEDDGENLLIIEDPNVAAENDNFLNENGSISNHVDIDDVKDQGKLVQQILETEKNFEGALGMDKKTQRAENVSYNLFSYMRDMRSIFIVLTGLRRVENAN